MCFCVTRRPLCHSHLLRLLLQKHKWRLFFVVISKFDFLRKTSLFWIDYEFCSYTIVSTFLLLFCAFVHIVTRVPHPKPSLVNSFHSQKYRFYNQWTGLSSLDSSLIDLRFNVFLCNLAPTMSFAPIQVNFTEVLLKNYRFNTSLDGPQLFSFLTYWWAFQCVFV